MARQAGFAHYDLFFIDCTTPSDDIIDKFLRLAERQVRLGGPRGGVLIAARIESCIVILVIIIQ